VIFFIVCFLATFAAALRKPAWCAAILFALDPFLDALQIGRTTITLPKVALVAVTLALLTRPQTFRVLLDRRCLPLLGGAIALMVANALTAIPGIYIDAVLRETLKAVEYGLIFICCTVASARDPDDAPFRLALYATTTVVCALALAQEFDGAPSAVALHGHVLARIAGPLEGPNQLAGFLDIAIGVLATLAVLARDRIAAMVGALALLTTVLTFSRSGILATILALVMLTFVTRLPRRVALVAGGVVAAAVAAIASAAGGLGRFGMLGETSAPTGLATRPQLWAAAIELWQRDPLLGVGAGNYELLLPTVPGLEGVRTHANSLYLQALAEGGIALLVATLWTVGASLATFLRTRSRDALVIGAGIASAALAFHQVFDCLTFYVKVGSAWWIVLGVAMGRVVVESRERVASAA
jgi:O-antigen ligase